MSRSKWKGPFFNLTLYNELLHIRKKSKVKFWKYKIQSRDSVIPSNLIRKRVLVHTGKSFKRVFVNREKVGLKFGALAKTRKFTFVLPKSLQKTKKK